MVKVSTLSEGWFLKKRNNGFLCPDRWDTDTGILIVTANDLKLRAGANTKYDVLASMAQGEKVQCYGYYTKESDGTVWLYVVYKGQTGFASKRYLKR